MRSIAADVRAALIVARLDRLGLSALWMAGAGLIVAVATYALALLALGGLEPPGVKTASLPADADTSSGAPRVAAIDGAGIARIEIAGRHIGTVGGHGTSVTGAVLVDGGSEAVTVSTDGSVRMTGVGALGTAGAAGVPRLAKALRQQLWEPYGKPVAAAALHVAAQVVPLHVPEAVRGRRGRAFRDCNGDFCGPEMIEIEPGRFLMGSPWLEDGRVANESPRRLLTVAKPIAIGRFAVTFADWDACVAGGGCKRRPSDNGWGRGGQPVIDVSWEDVTTEYLPWLNAELRLGGKAERYRLPSEAEWEYAARAGTTSAFWWGNALETGKPFCHACRLAKKAENVGTSSERVVCEVSGSFQTYCQAGYVCVEGGKCAAGPEIRFQRSPARVGSYEPNGFGLHDVTGNVREWVQDCYHASYAEMPDSVRTSGSAWDSDCKKNDDGQSILRVARGGSWLNVPQHLRSAHRDWTASDKRDTFSGFRLARTLAGTR